MNVPALRSSGGSVISYSPSQLQLIQRTVAKDLDGPEFDMFVTVCRRVGLDPFRRQIYANVYNKDKKDKRQVVFITAIDGFRAIAARNGNYRPDNDPPDFEYDETVKGPGNPTGLVRATVKVWRMDPAGAWYPIIGTARWQEFAPLTEEFDWIDTGEKWPDGKPKREKRFKGTWKLDDSAKFWRKMPEHMLGKCAEGQALRKGWPEDLSGIYVAEEMAQADLDERSASEVLEAQRETARLTAAKVANTIGFVMAGDGIVDAIPLGQIADRCMEVIECATSAQDLATWRDRNRVGLTEFWGRSPNDALEVKKALESRLATLEAAPAPESTPPVGTGEAVMSPLATRSFSYPSEQAKAAGKLSAGIEPFRECLANCTTTTDVDALGGSNAKWLQTLRDKSPAAYEDLMTAITARQSELRSQVDPAATMGAG